MATTTGSFKINKDGTHMMDTLGINPSRCEELCIGIEQTQSEHQSWSFGQVLQEAMDTHCKNDNEKLFMAYVFGTHQGKFEALDDLGILDAFRAAHSQFMAQHN